MRLDTCYSTNRIYVEHTDESQNQDWDLCLNGFRLLVRSSHAIDVA